MKSFKGSSTVLAVFLEPIVVQFRYPVAQAFSRKSSQRKLIGSPHDQNATTGLRCFKKLRRPSDTRGVNIGRHDDKTVLRSSGQMQKRIRGVGERREGRPGRPLKLNTNAAGFGGQRHNKLRAR